MKFSTFSESGTSIIGKDTVYNKARTIFIATVGSVKRSIMVTNHILLFDSAYARRAEKAEVQVGQVYNVVRKGTHSLVNAIWPSIAMTAPPNPSTLQLLK